MAHARFCSLMAAAAIAAVGWSSSASAGGAGFWVDPEPTMLDATDTKHAPWVLVEAPGLRGELAARGVVVRDTASFGLGIHSSSRATCNVPRNGCGPMLADLSVSGSSRRRRLNG